MKKVLSYILVISITVAIALVAMFPQLADLVINMQDPVVLEEKIPPRQPPLLLQAPEDAQAIDIEVPESPTTGDMVTLRASGSDKFVWRCYPNNGNMRVVDNGQVVHFCSGTPGDFLFVVSTVLDGQVVLTDVTVTIAKRLVPDRPQPANRFTHLIPTWLPENPDPEILEKLARSFERVASAGHKTTADLVKTTALSNRAALGSDLELYKPFLIGFSGFLKEFLKDASVDEHTVAWFEIAGALRSLK